MSDTENTENIKYYTLDNVASWQSPQGDNVVDVFIPRLQRGLVWNAARVEVFWDSLMRSIPLGCFSLTKMTEATKLQLKLQLKEEEDKDSYFLLDGQQRANAMALAYNPNFDEETKAILWLDLDYKKENGDLCKYKFYLTNIRHPWGYKNINKNSEIREEKLSVGEWSEIVIKEAKLETNLHFERPKPYKLWPKAAKMPIPMYCLLKNFEDDEKSFWEKLYTNIEDDEALYKLNWFKQKRCLLENWISSNENKSKKSEIFNAIKAIKNLKFPAFVCPDEMSKSQDEVSLYFKRINTQGVVPSAEEIQYSMVKSFWPELWDIEEVAKEKMMPYRFAKIALEVFYMQKYDKWIKDITDSEIRDLKQNCEKDFSGFIDELKDYSASIDVLFEALTPYHRTLLAQSSRHIYKLLLFLIYRFEKNALLNATEDKPNIFAGIATLIRWFAIKPAHEEKICKNIFESLPKAKNSNFELTWIQKGIIKSLNESLMITPISPENLAAFHNKKEGDPLYKSGDVFYESDEAWVKIKNVFSYGSYGEEMLLFATKEYVDKFNYNPANYEKWNKINRPWDYDHILPSKWVVNKKKGKYREACKEYINCIGNIAAIPYVINREKSDKPPKDTYYAGENFTEKDLKNLLINPDDISTYESNVVLCGNKSNKFLENTKKRFLEIYSKWYNDLKIEEIFKFDFNSLENDAELKIIYQRRELFEEIKNTSEFNDVYYLHRNLHFKVKEDFDWAYTSISVGKIEGDKYICITNNSDDNGSIQIGIRRLPNDNSIPWWENGFPKHLEYEWGNENSNAKSIIDKLNKIKENNGR